MKKLHPDICILVCLFKTTFKFFTLFQVNLSPELTIEKLRKLFEEFGEIEEIKLKTILRENSRVKLLKKNNLQI